MDTNDYYHFIYYRLCHWYITNVINHFVITVNNDHLYWLVVWNIFYFSIYGECHNPNWRTHIFQRGRAQPPTRILLTIINHIITITIYYPLLTVYPTSKCLFCLTLWHVRQRCHQVLQELWHLELLPAELLEATARWFVAIQWDLTNQNRVWYGFITPNNYASGCIIYIQYIYIYRGVSIVMGVPQARWMIWVHPYFRKPPHQSYQLSCW